MTRDRVFGPLCAVIGVLALGGCQHARTERTPRTEKLQKLLQRERTARRLAELEKKVLELKLQVARRDQQLAQLGAPGGAQGQAGGKGAGRPAVPPKASDAKAGCPTANSKPLKIEIRGYHSRKMEIVVRNPDCRTRAFSPKGLYFVPMGSRPQRMGAAGPYEIWLSGAWQPVQGGARTFLAPGQRMRMRLQVYCLDHGRAEPPSGQSYRVARSRMPKPLQQRLYRAVNPYTRGRRRLSRPAKRRVQRRIWDVRNAFDSPLDGD